MFEREYFQTIFCFLPIASIPSGHYQTIAFPVMKNILLLTFISLSAWAQIETPTIWEKPLVKNQNPSVGETIDVVFKAKIKKGWYLYSANFDPEIGPIVTTFSFKEHPSYQVVGKIQPKGQKVKMDEVWQAEIPYFTESATFVQRIKILAPLVELNGSIEFQTCTDIDGRCINGKEKFSLTYKAKPASLVKKDSLSNIAIKEAVDSQTVLQPSAEAVVEKPVENVDNPVETSTNPEESEENSLWEFLLIAFTAGFASIFMPCIYPIMPMTVSFFTKQEKGRAKALFYGASIMAIFSVMGLITMVFGAPFLNFISTHWAPNLLFFILFIVFGISLLGFFEIVLPHETVNKIDQLSEKGGLIGIFFMALTLVVVSFSCTVPFVGSLLIYSAQGEVMRPLYGMLAFGLPFALVFGGLAMFPQYLKKLPKSGGWLNELKAVFGLLEFALALKFLSNIDLAYHFNLIHRNIFILIWVVIGTLITLYILGWIRTSKDSRIEKYTFTRLFFAGLFGFVTLWMIPGVAGKPLNALSGILPPMPIAEQTSLAPAENMRALPHGLWGFNDMEDAQAYAKKVNKPILIDFTGYACANCRKMEENVWPDPEVLRVLAEEFVIASLYVDDKKELPKKKQYFSTYSNEQITTIGAKNMEYEITQFNNNAQPYYVIVRASGEVIQAPLGYATKEKFLQWMKEGIQKFK